MCFHSDKGWKLKNVPFSFYPWCIQSELSLVKHGQQSKVRRVLKLTGSPLFNTGLTFDYYPCFTRDNSD